MYLADCVAQGIKRYTAEHGDIHSVVFARNGARHSWRIAILPYMPGHDLDAREFSKQLDYRMEEPWNSRHNREALRSVPWDCLTCPLESENKRFYPCTSYLWLVRPNTVGEDSRRLAPDAVIIVESALCGIQHAEPKDIKWEDLWKGESPFGKGKLNSLHPGIVKALRVDGKVIDIPKDIGKDELRQLLNGSI